MNNNTTVVIVVALVVVVALFLWAGAGSMHGWGGMMGTVGWARGSRRVAAPRS